MNSLLDVFLASCFYLEDNYKFSYQCVGIRAARCSKAFTFASGFQAACRFYTDRNALSQMHLFNERKLLYDEINSI